MKNILLLILDWTWCFPQTFIGWVFQTFFWRGELRPHPITDEFYTSLYISAVEFLDRKLYKIVPGVSFGRYIFLHYFNSDNTTIRHECGHSVQSRMLGWFYLLVVGLPSVYGNLKARVDKERNRTYYEHYPENWADCLGKVKRK